MKKNVLKAMSVGLSAITIASTLSVPVYADEPSENQEPGANQEASESQGSDEKDELGSGELNEDVPEANKEQPKNIPENRIKSELEDLDDDFILDNTDSDTEGIQEIAGLSQGPGDSDKFPDGDQYQQKRPFGREIDFSDEGKEILRESENAGKKIEKAETDMGNNIKAAEDMDEAEDDANTAVNAASGAVKDITDAVNGATRDIGIADSAIDFDTTPNATLAVETAGSSLETAEKVLTEKKQVYNNAVSAYEQAEQDYKDAAAEYEKYKELASGDLASAERKLKRAQKRLEELEDAVKKAQKEYADSAAGQLYAANEKANEDPKTKYNFEYDIRNAEAIIEYYILDKDNIKNVNIERIDWDDSTKGDAFFDISYTKNGRRVNERYGFKFNWDGTLDIYNTAEYYEYQQYNAWGQIETVRVQEKDLKNMVDRGTAVKRYQVGGKYYTEEEVWKTLHKNPAYLDYEYVVLEAYMDSPATYADFLEPGEKDVKTLSKTAHFDAWGNYYQTIVNKTTQTKWFTINGKVVFSETLYDVETKGEVYEAVYEQNDEEVRKTVQEMLNKGFFDGKNFVTRDQIQGVEWINEGFVNVAIVWKLDGTYVPVYAPDCPCAPAQPDKRTEEINTAVDTTKFVTEDAIKAEYAKQFTAAEGNSNYIVTGVELIYEDRVIEEPKPEPKPDPNPGPKPGPKDKKENDKKQSQSLMIQSQSLMIQSQSLMIQSLMIQSQSQSQSLRLKEF